MNHSNNDSSSQSNNNHQSNDNSHQNNSSSETQTHDIKDNQLIAERKSKLTQIRQSCPSNAHPNHFRKEDACAELQSQYSDLSKEALLEKNIIVSVAGRIMAKRGPFYVIQDVSGKIQTYAHKEVQKDIKSRWGELDLGDIIGVKGQLKLSGKGDLYVNMEDYVLLTKSLRPLPDKYSGLRDQESRYRQRYVDLIINEETRQTFLVRTKVIDGIRRYLNERNFLEVETPMLQVIPGGATAKPFITHHNAMDIEMYLRIAPELYLKRLIVGGLERVFEINRNFRNEGLSTRHNPEFTMLEFYHAYADYHDLMDLTEDMLKTITQDILGTTKVTNTTRNQDNEVVDTIVYDFGQPFVRISMTEAVLNNNPQFEADIFKHPEDNIDTLTQYAQSVGIVIPEKAIWGAGKLITEIFEATVEETLIQPTFITEYPWEVSPLARRNDDNPFITDRFEFFVGGREIANGFSELNDAEDQAERFHRQVAELNTGDEEAMHFDDDYIRALEYGLPPTAGEGIGIDRLVMLLTDSPTIKDVILFPHMKPEK